jgi:hypothetical protein
VYTNQLGGNSIDAHSIFVGYLPGAGGNFLCSLLRPRDYKLATNNEYRPVNESVYNTPLASNTYPTHTSHMYGYNNIFKSHDPLFADSFNHSYIIYSVDPDVISYLNVLAAIKVESRYNNLGRADMLEYIKFKSNPYHKWIPLYKMIDDYIDYKELFVNLNAPKLWDGYQEEIRLYHQHNIELLSEFSTKYNIDVHKYLNWI